MVTLVSERVILRPWTDEDIGAWTALNADAEVMRYFPAPLTPAESEAMAEQVQRHLREHGWGLWALEVPERIAFAGFVGLMEATFPAHFTPALEVGWRLSRDAWGHGYASEGARLALAHAFIELGREEVVSFTAEGNARSRAVMERIGMVRDPADDFDHPRLEEGHRLRRHVLYRLGRAAREVPAPVE